MNQEYNIFEVATFISKLKVIHQMENLNDFALKYSQILYDIDHHKCNNVQIQEMLTAYTKQADCPEMSQVRELLVLLLK
ncbi:hypothetical protein pb186bvf_013221 [Paramecium bursaria]